MLVSLTLLSCAMVIGLLYQGRGYAAWSLGAAVGLLAWLGAGVQSPWLFGTVALAAGAGAWLFDREGPRRRLVTARVMPLVARILPRLGERERVALEAGTVWWDGDLFSGRPDWRKLLAFSPRQLSPVERAFLDGPVEQLCAMLDDWDVQQVGDLPADVWALLKQERFFGMIIPEEHGGLGFSAIAHSAVVTGPSARGS